MKIVSLLLLASLALFQSCSSASRSVAQEQEFEEKKHHYPALRHIDRH